MLASRSGCDGDGWDILEACTDGNMMSQLSSLTVAAMVRSNIVTSKSRRDCRGLSAG